MARLLIIDDEKMICQEFCSTLADLGHSAEYALNANEALQKIEKNSYDLVFLDLSMPRMNGADLFKKIREVRQVPVTFMAGFMSPTTEQEVLALGAVRCLRKPVHLSEIVELIDSLGRLSPQSN